MKVLEDIKELIEEELKAMKKKGSVSPAELDSIHKAVETIKYIDEICEKDCEDDEESKYSGKRMMMHRNGMYSGNYPMPVYYNGDNGYSGCHYDPYYDSGNRRYYGDSYETGHHGYSAEGTRAGRNYGYSREGATSHMVDKLETMLDNACTPKEREAIRSCIDKLMM